ncbi:MAG: 50S ribosomal protein L24 [Bradymonadales bacterium]|jgi:large subunit ribosomal protein L24
MKIKKGDKVIILSGKDRGTTGRVLRVDKDASRVFVEGRALASLHKKASPTGQEAGIIKKESGIHVSNVALYSEQLNRGVRVCSRYMGQDKKLYASKAEALASLGEGAKHARKVRFAKKTGEIFE